MISRFGSETAHAGPLAMVLGFVTLAGHKLGPSRLLTRSKGLTAIIVVGLCSIISLSCLLPAFSVKTKLGRLLPTGSVKNEADFRWNSNPRRLIVFGDSWSDDGQYPVDPPSRDEIPIREEGQGKVWTEWLCTTASGKNNSRQSDWLIRLQISCTHHDNFATGDAVVDSSLLNKTMLKATNFNNTLVTNFALDEPLADLRSQIQQWLKFERQQYGTTRVSEVERSSTVFTIWFSLWDLWYYSEKNMADAQYAVTKAIDILFEQLETVAENWPMDMKIIMPEAIDPTFLPRWRGLRTGPRGSDPYGENQRNAVLLAEQWNRALDMRATHWQGGSMYIYNTNEWLMDQVRGQELFEAHLTDSNGMGSTSPWHNVRSGCIEFNDTNDDDAGAERCADPSTYLFWDDWHLGSSAMRMIGEDIGQDLASGGSLDWFAHEVDIRHVDRKKSRPKDAATKGPSSSTSSASPATSSPLNQSPP